MSKHTVSFSESDLTNGARFALAMWEAGVDITEYNVNRTFSNNIAFSNAARTIRTLAGSDKRTIRQAVLQVADEADHFSLVYAQQKEAGATKAEAVAAAQASVAALRLDSSANLNKPAQTEAAEAHKVLGEKKTGKVQPFGKPEDAHNPTQPAKGLSLNESFKIDSDSDSVWKVFKTMSVTGEMRVNRTRGMDSRPNEGSKFTVNGKTYVVTKHMSNSDTAFNISAMPAKAESTLPASVPNQTPAKGSKGKSAKSVKPEAAPMDADARMAKLEAMMMRMSAVVESLIE